MEVKEIKVSIKEETDRFKRHLELQYNDQIIFSGIFGIGKTHFIKEFFGENTDDYEVFLLSPVNYSIAQTDDIIEYIKYDIAFQLFGKDIDFKKEDFSVFQTAQYYAQDNFMETMILIAKMVPKTGRVFADIFENLQKLRNRLAEHNDLFQIDEEKELLSFLKGIKNEGKSIYEEDRVTELICGLVETLKTKNESKETVLVIDDLDRLDPEHIFRIMNVFACHFDLDTDTENKFGFDKIILVCDIDNIRNVFHSKYGIDVDFSGYVDKFYSREVFYFDNKKALSQSVNEILSSIKTSHQLELGDSGMVSTRFVRVLIEDLIFHNILNLRLLLKAFNTNCFGESYSFKIGPSYQRFHNRSFRLLAIFELLLHIFGSRSAMSLAFDKLAKKTPSKIIEDNSVYEVIVEFVDYKQHKGKKENYTFINSELNLMVNYDLQVNAYGQYAKIQNVTYFDKNDDFREEFPFAPLLKIAYGEYQQIEKI